MKPHPTPFRSPLSARCNAGPAAAPSQADRLRAHATDLDAASAALRDAADRHEGETADTKRYRKAIEEARRILCAADGESLVEAAKRAMGGTVSTAVKHEVPTGPIESGDRFERVSGFHVGMSGTALALWDDGRWDMGPHWGIHYTVNLLDPTIWKRLPRATVG